MKVAVYVLVGCIWTGGILSADSITLSNTAAWNNFSSVFNPSQGNPTQGSQGAPFWNNWSYDAGVGGSHDTNIGYMLSGTGGFAGTDVLGQDSVGAAALVAGASDPSSFTFTPNTSQSYTVTLLGAYSGNSTMQAYGTQFGIYYMSGSTIVYDQLYGPGGNGFSDTAAIPLTGALRTTSLYGFYATVCYGPVVDGVCHDSETFYSNSALNNGFVSSNPGLFPAGGGAYNHFAVFGLNSDNGNYGNGNWVIGFKDGPVTAEGMGDFNDIVIELADPSDFPVTPSVPEPATFGIVGSSLVALAIVRRRATQK